MASIDCPLLNILLDVTDKSIESMDKQIGLVIKTGGTRIQDCALERVRGILADRITFVNAHLI